MSDSEHKGVVTIKVFNKYITEIIQLMKALKVLKKQLKKGYILSFVDNKSDSKTPLKFDHNDMKMAEKKLMTMITDLRAVFSHSKKKSKDQSDPSSFKGVYRPVLAGAALQAFFVNGGDGFGYLSPIVGKGNTPEERLRRANLQLQRLTAAENAFADATGRYNQYRSIVNNAATSDKSYVDEAKARYDRILDSDDGSPTTRFELEKLADDIDAVVKIIEQYHKTRKDYAKLTNIRLARGIAGDSMDEFIRVLTQPLTNYLPSVLDGRLLRNTIIMLAYTYLHERDLQDKSDSRLAFPDPVMNAAFGGDIPATFYSYRLPGTGKPDKALMVDAANSQVFGLNGRLLNTFQVLESMYPIGTLTKKGDDGAFHREKFQTYFFNNIAAANYYSATSRVGQDVAVLLSELDDLTLRERMLNEHNIVLSVSNEWNELLEPKRLEAANIKKKDTALKNKEKRANAAK